MSESLPNIIVINIGRAAGKTKYLLVDKSKAELCSKLVFMPRVMVDRDASCVKVMAWCYEVAFGEESGQFVHELIWEQCHGALCMSTYHVVPKNGVYIDCRVDNLSLISGDMLSTADTECHHCETVYWQTIEHIVVNPLDELQLTSWCGYYTGDGLQVTTTDVMNMFHECHYAPCTRIEQLLRQFSVCGRCQSVRYCSVACQQYDWSVHRKFCRKQRTPFYPVYQPIDR